MLYETFEPDFTDLYSLFRNSVLKYPENIAHISSSGQNEVDRVSLTYRKLNQKVNVFAERLEFLFSSAEFIAIIGSGLALTSAILASSKAGFPFVPIDPKMEFPTIERIFRQIDFDIIVVGSYELTLISDQILGLFKQYRLRVLVVDSNDGAIHDHLTSFPQLMNENSEHRQTPEIVIRKREYAYIMMSSGSSGDPKIIQVTHDSVIPNILDLSARMAVTDQDRIILTAPSTFDPSIMQIFMAYSSGACLVCAVSGTQFTEFPKIMAAEQVSILQVTPSLFELWTPDSMKPLVHLQSQLRIIAFGGEDFPPVGLLRRNHILSMHGSLHPYPKNNRSIELWNLYGTTEMSIWAFANRIDPNLFLESTTNLPEHLGHHGLVSLGEPLLETLFALEESQKDFHLYHLLLGSKSRKSYVWGVDSEMPAQAKGKEQWRKTGDIVYKDPKTKKLFYFSRTGGAKVLGHQVSTSAIEREIVNNHSDQVKSVEVFKLPVKIGIMEVPTTIPSLGVNIETTIPMRADETDALARKIVSTLRSRLGPYHVPWKFLFNASIPVQLSLHGKSPIDRSIPDIINEISPPGSILTTTTTSDASSIIDSPPQSAYVHGAIDILIDLVRKTLALSELDVEQTSKQMLVTLGGTSIDAVRIVESLLNDFIVLVMDVDASMVTKAELFNLIMNYPLSTLAEYLTELNPDKSIVSGSNIFASFSRESSEKNLLSQTTTTTNNETNTLTSKHQALEIGHKRQTSFSLGGSIIHPHLHHHLPSLLPSPTSFPTFTHSTGTNHFISRSASSSTLNNEEHINQHLNLYTFHHKNKNYSTTESTASIALEPNPKRQKTHTSNTKTTTSTSPISPVSPTSNVLEGFVWSMGRTNKFQWYHMSPLSQKFAIQEAFAVLGNLRNVSLPLEIPLKSKLTIHWRFGMRKCVDSSPVLAGSGSLTDRRAVLIGSHAGLFACVDFETGKTFWEVMLQDRIESSALVTPDGKHVIVGCYGGRIYKLSTSDGSIEATYKAESDVKTGFAISTNRNLWSRVWFGCHDHRLYCLNLSDLSFVFGKYFGKPFAATPLVNPKDHRVLTAGTDGAITCFFQLSDGRVQEIWNQTFAKPFFSTPLFVDSSDILIAPCCDGTIYAFDASTGDLVWRSIPSQTSHQPLAPFFSSPCLVDVPSLHPEKEHPDLPAGHFMIGNHKQFALVGCHDDQVYLIDVKTGQVESFFNCGAPVYSSPSFAFQNGDRTKLVIAVATIVGKVLLLSLDLTPAMDEKSPIGSTKLKLIQSIDLPAGVFSSPVIDSESVVVGCRDNFVYRIKW